MSKENNSKCESEEFVSILALKTSYFLVMISSALHGNIAVGISLFHIYCSQITLQPKLTTYINVYICYFFANQDLDAEVWNVFAGMLFKNEKVDFSICSTYSLSSSTKKDCAVVTIMHCMLKQ